MTTALIIGAGVAGATAALALHKAGVTPIVCEAHAGTADEVGAFLTLQPNGLDALRAVDAREVVDRLGFPTPRIRFASGTGKPLGEVPNGGTLADGTVSRTMRRSDLYRALNDEVARRGIAVHHGRRLVDASPAAGGVTATFADGTTERADLLVGCDGIHSQVRRAIDPQAPAPRYARLLDVGGVAPGVATDGRPGEYVMSFGRRAFFGYAVAPGDQVWWFANPPQPDEPGPGELAAVTSDQWRRRLLDTYFADRSPAVDLIEATPGPLQGWATYDVPRVPRWHAGPMVVIGDAAHAASPSSGQGASLAVEDAVELARCLRDLPTAAALVAFEGLRRRRVERVVAHGARFSNDKVAGPVGRVVRDLALPFVLRRMARDGGRSLAWLHAHHIDWDAPVTPDRARPRPGERGEAVPGRGDGSTGAPP